MIVYDYFCRISIIKKKENCYAPKKINQGNINAVYNEKRLGSFTWDVVVNGWQWDSGYPVRCSRFT